MSCRSGPTSRSCSRSAPCSSVSRPGCSDRPSNVRPVEDRQERERRAYDEDRVFEESSKWHKRAHHVLTGPNTAKAEALFDDLIRKAVTGGRALDICCGSGIRSVHILE